MHNNLFIQDGIIIPEHELIISSSRSGGPGGQHVNKTNSKIIINWNPLQSTAFQEDIKSRILENLKNKLNAEGFLVIHNSKTRSQIQNKSLAYQELAKQIRKALYVPKKRNKTKSTKSAQEKRLKKKKQRSEIKKLRKVFVHDTKRTSFIYCYHFFYDM